MLNRLRTIFFFSLLFSFYVLFHVFVNKLSMRPIALPQGSALAPAEYVRAINRIIAPESEDEGYGSAVSAD